MEKENVGQTLSDNLIKLSSPKGSVGDLRHTYRSDKREIPNLNNYNTFVCGRFPTTTLGNDNLLDCKVKPDLHTRSKGFTLIELLVVVLIIGILAAVALPQYQQAVLKSKMVQSFNKIHALDIAQREYYLENGVFSRSIANLNISTVTPCYDHENYLVFCKARSNNPNFELEWQGHDTNGKTRWVCIAFTDIARTICKSYLNQWDGQAIDERQEGTWYYGDWK